MRRTFLALPVSAAVLWAAGSGDNIRALPSKTDTAANTLALLMHGPNAPFQGVQKVHVKLNGADLASTVRVFSDGRGASRHEYEGGAAGTVIIRSPHGIWRRTSAGEWLELQPSALPVDFAIRATAKNYAVSVAPAGAMFGRPAVSVRVVPKRPFNPSRRVIMDGSTGTVLRDELYAPDGSLRSSSVFVSLAFRPQSAALFALPMTHVHPIAVGPASFSVRQSSEAVENETGFRIPAPAYCPPGYVLVVVGVMRTGSGRRLPAVRFSDGLASFTIFRRGRGPREGHGFELHAAHSSDQESVVAYRSRDANYLLIGDISLAELDRVAKSLP